MIGQQLISSPSSKALPMNDPRRSEHKLGLMGGGKINLQFVVGKIPE
jgi:hypothetical protein